MQIKFSFQGFNHKFTWKNSIPPINIEQLKRWILTDLTIPSDKFKDVTTSITFMPFCNLRRTSNFKPILSFLFLAVVLTLFFQLLSLWG